MNAEQRNTAEGRILETHREAKQELVRLTAEATRLGQEFSRLGEALQNRPEYVGLSGESPMSIEILPEDRVIVQKSLFDAEKIKALTDDIRRAMETQKRMAEKIKELGG